MTDIPVLRPRFLKLPDKPGHLLAGQVGHPFEIPKDHALLLPPKLFISKPCQGALDQRISFVLDHTEQASLSLQKLFYLRQRLKLRVVHIDHHAVHYERFDRFQTHTILDEASVRHNPIVRDTLSNDIIHLKRASRPKGPK